MVSSVTLLDKIKQDPFYQREEEYEVQNLIVLLEVRAMLCMVFNTE